MSSIQQTAPRLLTLVDYNHPLLRQKAEPVKFPLSAEDKQLISDMLYSVQAEQLKKANAPWEAAVGMAANQWGINKQIFLFYAEDDSVGRFKVIINPSYQPLNENKSNVAPQAYRWESCFSIPLAAGNIQRYLHIKVKYQNEDGEIITKELHDWPARVWQHENDHLNGILYDDPKAKKCIVKRQFMTKEEVKNFYKNKEEQEPK